MILAIDVGNTNIVLGAFDGSTLLMHWRISSDRCRTPDEYRTLLASMCSVDSHHLPGSTEAVVIGSVVPSLTQTLSEACQIWIGKTPCIITTEMDLGLRLLVREPTRVGIDRVLNAVAAKARYSTPSIIVDLGTATKFDVVNRQGDFIGGAIAPGFSTSADALVQRTALLPHITYSLPSSAIGDDTVSAMRSGIVLGYISLIEGLLERMKSQLAAEECVVIATGGIADLIFPHVPSLEHFDPHLTLHGLQIVHARKTS